MLKRYFGADGKGGISIVILSFTWMCDDFNCQKQGPPALSERFNSRE